MSVFDTKLTSAIEQLEAELTAYRNHYAYSAPEQIPPMDRRSEQITIAMIDLFKQGIIEAQQIGPDFRIENLASAVIGEGI